MYTYGYDKTTTIIVIVILLIICILSIIINAFLLNVLLRMSDIKYQVGAQLIALVALGDFLGATSVTASSISWLVLGYPGIIESSWYCSTFGVVVYLFHNMSGIVLSVLALERYLVICHHIHLPEKITYLILITVGIIFAILLIGNGVVKSFAMDPTYIFCLPFGSDWAFAAGTLFNILVNLPLIILTFCYIGIFLKCRTCELSSNKDQITKKVAKRTLTFIFIYLVCYIPKFASTIISVIKNDVNSPPLILYILAPITLSLIMMMNPILALFLHNLIKEKVLVVLFPNQDKLSRGSIRLE